MRFDNFFSDAHSLLADAEFLRSGIEDTKTKGAEASHTNQLVDPKFVDTIQVLLWSASADNKGNIANSGAAATHTPPYFTIDGGKCRIETMSLFSLFQTYIKTIMEGPEKLKHIIEKLADMSERAPGLIEDGKSDIQNSSMGFSSKLKATADLIKNGAKLPKELKKCRELEGTIKQAKVDLEELLPRLKDLIASADDVGAKAYNAGCLKPAEIFDKFHPGPKKAASGKK